MALSRGENNKVLDHFSGKTAWTFTADRIFVGLSSTTPTITGGGVNEPSGGAYARVNITGAQFAAAANSATENNTDKSFPKATATWVASADLTHLVFYDAASAGNFLMSILLTTAKKVLIDDTAKILNGDLDIAITESVS